jgi:hypothetical protein
MVLDGSLIEMKIVILGAFLFLHTAFSTDAKSSISCQICQLGLQTISTKLQGNTNAMQQLSDQLSEGCDQIPSVSQQSACMELFDPSVFPDLVKNFADSEPMEPGNVCKQMGFCS